MLIIVGAVVVLGAVIGGFLMAGGELMVLLIQPAEFVVIGGAALGSLIVSTPPKVLKTRSDADQGVFGGGTTDRRTTSTCWRCCTRSSSWCSSPA